MIRGVGDGVRGQLSQIASVSTTRHRLPLALKWEAVLAALPCWTGFQHTSVPPSNTVVVSSVFLGEVIFKTMKEGFMSVFHDHMLYLMYNQQINSTVKGMNTDLSFAKW